MPEKSGAVPDLPEAIVRTKKSLSIVWLIPLVALVIGGWLAYKALSEKGPTITITFLTAEGLEAGKTKIKYKDVEVGEVESITLSKDLSHVVVTANLVKGAEKFLTEKTNFWVVRAQITAGQISGLGTLFSGAYIGIEPGTEGKKTRSFTGLEYQPIVTRDVPGRQFVLHSDNLGSLEINSPVYFRQIKVGEVVSYKLDEDGEAVSIKVFIHAPHHDKVRSNTRFWNAGGVDVSVGADGIKVDTQSFVSIMIGGIAFDTPASLDAGDPVEKNHKFRLYKNRESIHEVVYRKKEHFILHFEDSVRGLSRGAPVEFRGIKIGEVVDISLVLHEEHLQPKIPVLIELQPQRMSYVGKRKIEGKERLEMFVAKGMRAQLKTGSLLTGQLFVDLDFHPEAPEQPVIYGGKYPELPTVPSPLEQITTQLASIVDKLDKLPIEQIGNDLKGTVQGADRLVNAPELLEAIQALNQTLQQTQQLAQTLNAEVAPQVSGTLEQAQKSLAAVESVVGSDSALQHELRRALVDLAEAARAISVLTDFLERHPDSLIYGKGQGK